MMGYSNNCRNLTTRWNPTTQTCVPCDFRPGYKVSPNCGFDDRGGRHVPPFIKCAYNTFNDGRRADCRNCTLCPPSLGTESPCNATTDTLCREGNPTAPAAAAEQISYGSAVVWALALAVFASVLLVVLITVIICRRQKRGQHTALAYRKSLSVNEGLAAPACNSNVEDTLSPEILSAPLQTVLDNLDVLEELVILLDPDSNAVKSTKHLASHCSFSSTWITYTYSMKDSKSPLRTVLEGVTSKYPDWTVGHLVKLLHKMERNDAVAVLAKLRLNEMAV